MQNPLTSPVTGSKNIEKKLSIPVSEVIAAYRNDDLEEATKYLERTKTVDIYECLDTGYRFYYPFTIFGDDKFYEYLQLKKPSYSHLRWEHGPALKLLDNNKSVLEVGSGSGEFIEKASEVAKEVKGLEFNQKAIKSSRNRGLDVTGESIEEHSRNNPAHYDVVCMFQVLEHIHDIKPFLTASVGALKKGGKLVIGVPNNNPYLFRYDTLHTLNLPPHHSGLWDKHSLSALTKYYNLELETLAIEPLQEVDYYWQVQRDHWKDKAYVLYLISSLLSIDNFSGIRRFLLRKFCKGRNILAIYRKK